ncbi:Uncharacterized conserved protein [Plasmopara halstedii]|uniref:Uncharacterized conserved protein n=1 Tax=Plasmopara halstedii TaxID=4781 RepID=A0A0P1AG40_PLAHL|nr:Uncharacterized conserved protein [Plasmopara halstedii]CEG39584.1 Uncharacterized conserved protein [Plasmopara halstedii]|eukprot:XP_024575953.1 Uncharacterized conserved protein [Plasmopara halstedii]
MSEADAFIFAVLQQNGWLEGDSTWTVKELSSDKLIVIVLEFLARLQDTHDDLTLNLPCVEAKAPVGVAARHRIGSQLANILKELGYAGDCGYNHFLYPTEKETRNILSWLVGKLPRSKLEESEDEASQSRAMDTSMNVTDTKLDRKQLASIFSCWKQEKTLHMLPNPNFKELRGFQRLPLKTFPLELPWNGLNQSTCYIFKNFPKDCVKATSLLEALAVAKRNSATLLDEEEFEEGIDLKAVDDQRIHEQFRGNVTDAQFQEREVEDDDFAAILPYPLLMKTLPDIPLAFENLPPAGTGESTEDSTSKELANLTGIEASPIGGKDVVQIDICAEGDEEMIEQLQKQVEESEHRIAAMRKELDRERGELHEVEQHMQKTQASIQEMRQQLERQKQLLALLPEAEANIAKLKHLCRESTAKKAEIAQQMEIAREPLLKELTALNYQRSSFKARRRQLIREIKAMKAEMLEISGNINSKMESLRALEKHQERRLIKPKENASTMTRSMYTSRIMDIIKQVHKQKQDIAKILNDINGIQRQLNTAAEKLKRTEAEAEEKLYIASSRSKTTGSSKADAYIESYRKFAHVREIFEELLLVIDDAGKKENAARDLQNWITQLEARDSSSHLDKVLADLQSVRHENDILQNKLRASNNK